MTTATPSSPEVISSTEEEQKQVDGENHQNSSSTESSKAARDDEDLLLEYDVILCGTGLVQSILASALARVGKSVLHCDAQGHYGELDAVWTFPFLQEQLKTWNQQQQQQQQQKPPTQTMPVTATSPATPTTSSDDAKKFIGLSPQGGTQSLHILSSHTATTFPMEVGTKVVTPYGHGTIRELSLLSTPKVAVSLDDWTLANGKSPMVYFGIPTDQSHDNIPSYLSETQDVLPLRTLQAQTILNLKSRSLALDVTPGLVYASGSAVMGMLISGVAEYLDFKSIEGLLWLDAATTKQLSRVPCSKGDVFSSQLLPPLDKRRLMKFLQLALDYATALQMAQEEEEAQAITTETTTTVANTPTTASDESTSSGPADPTTTVKETHVQSLNERQLNQGRSLARPQNKAVSTNEFQELQQCIAENMDFERYLTEKQKLSPNLCTLIRYALALESGIGRSSTQEGMAKLCRHMQALGRYGSTAFLFPLYGSGELPQAFCRSAAVHGATYLLRRAPLQICLSEDDDDNKNTVKGIVLGGDRSALDESLSFGVGCRDDKMIRCHHVIVPQGALTDEPLAKEKQQQRVLRRISIFRGKLIASDINGGEQRHVVIIPPGVVDNEFAIHAIALDHTVNVAPQVPCGCTVLHLSTMIGSHSSNMDDQQCILEKAVTSLLSAAATAEVDEIFHVSFVYNADAPTDEYSSINGLHVCRLSREGLAVDDAFDHAKEIFASICPNHSFLAMSSAMDKAVKERFPDHGQEEDDEGMVLKSAMTMLNS